MEFSSHGLSSCPCKAEVCDFSGTCRHVSTCFTFQLSLINEDLNTLIHIDIKSARVASMQHDLIIGLPNIRKYKLLVYNAYKFTELSSSLRPTEAPPVGMKGAEFATLRSLSPRLSAHGPRVRKHLR